tara:strand:- start:1016 stop:2428 length:1413 start_codon:yes stop_codon:yes gene_type:complete
MYDYTIIGGGPSGIFCADKLSMLGYSVCLIESLETLGGCHRVRYVTDNKGNKIHTEHGPRIYLGSYLDFWKWIKSVDINRDENFERYRFDILSKSVKDFSGGFNISEILSIILMYIICCILRVSISDEYTLEKFSNDFNYTEQGKEKLNRLARLIDGGNLDKSLVSAFFGGFDVGVVYKIYEPNEPLDKLLWGKFHNKLINQKVDILLKTEVKSINKNNVDIGHKNIITDNIILTIPPYSLNKINNAPSLAGFNKNFKELSQIQQYEPYVCSSILFKNYGESSWGIADDHPWGLVAIDMGYYFKNVNGSLYIVSVTHPEKIDPQTNKKANDMNEKEFLDRIVEIVKKRFKINEEPIYKSLSPNVQKINGNWIESDRAFLYSPPGWLKPDFEISKKNKVFTTGHHIGNSYHDYNSMESAIQNASELLNKILPEYNKSISKPWKLSSILWIIIIIMIGIFINKKKIKKYIMG